MNKQRKTYILLVAVIVIWSIIGFQFLGSLEANNEELFEVAYKKFIPKQAEKKELYTVAVHNRDPFLGKYSTPKKQIKPRIIKEKKPVHFPQIQYKGIIINGDKQLFVLTINGTQKIVERNQFINDIELITGNDKEITVKYKGEVKTFLK